MKALLVNFVRMTALITFLIVMSAPSFAQQKQVTYYHVNTQGSPVAATNELAEIKWRQEYTNFGLQAIASGQPDDVNQSSFGLTGHVEDQFDDISLVYMQARYYDPSLGRFLSIDAAGFDEANPQSFNRYAYANNNPHRYVDPDGNIIFLAPLIYSAAVFVAKEVAVQAVSEHVPIVEYLGVRKGVTAGVKALSKLFRKRGRSGPENVKDRIRVKDVTEPGSRLPNFDVDKTKTQFEDHLLKNGFDKSVIDTPKGPVNVFSKNGKKEFTTRDFARSTDGPTGEIFSNGEKTAKIRFTNE